MELKLSEYLGKIHYLIHALCFKKVNFGFVFGGEKGGLNLTYITYLERFRQDL